MTQLRDFSERAGMAIVVAGLLMLILRCCATNPEPSILNGPLSSVNVVPAHVSGRADSLPMHVRIVTPVKDTGDDTHRDTLYVTLRDTTALDSMRRTVAHLVAETEHLRDSLKTLGAFISWRLDTITAEHDTVMIECEQVRRSISYMIRPHAITVSIPERPVSLAVGLGAAVTFDGRIVPALAITLSYSLLRF